GPRRRQARLRCVREPRRLELLAGWEGGRIRAAAGRARRRLGRVGERRQGAPGHERRAQQLACLDREGNPRLPGDRGAAHPSPRLGRKRDLARRPSRSEEHTSELQSRVDLVCRLLLEKKNNLYWSISYISLCC